MRLTDFFKTDRLSADAEKAAPQAQADSAAAAQAVRRVRAMAPGQTIQGEVVARNGSEVQIKLSDDVIVSARLDRNIHIEVGKNVMFQVRNQGQSLILSPLFANMAADANALKALEMASLPINDATVELTRQLMGAGQPIDRNALQQAFREVMAFPDAEAADMIDLHKLSLPVTRENLEQLASYKNLTHQLVGGMNEVLDALPGVLQDMAQKGNVEGAAKLYGQILALAADDYLAGEAAAGKPDAGAALSGEAAVGKSGAEAIVFAEAAVGTQDMENTVSKRNEASKGNAAFEESAVSKGNAASEESTVSKGSAVSIESAAPKGNTVSIEAALPGEAAVGKSGAVLRDGSLSDTAKSRTGEGISQGGRPAGAESAVGDASQGAARMDGTASKNISPNELQTGGMPPKDASAQAALPDDFPEDMQTIERIKQLLQEGVLEHDTKLLKGILGNRDLQALTRDVLLRNWTIRPEEVAQPKRVEALYERLGRQLKGVVQALENAGQTASEAYKASVHLGRNLDFLQQMNQMYAYVQLPLRLQQGNAHGELYVYANKKSLASKDGAVSALLHLDMDHLGPVDVYVSMQNSRVSTQFYVSDSEILDFLEARMDLLTQRLQKRGYDCSCKMQTRDGKENEAGNGRGVIQNLLAGGGSVKLAQYAFDVRA